MFRKKHSEINIQGPNLTLSPYRKNSNCSPFSRTPDRSNLSPMKNIHNNQGHFTKSPRKQFTCELYCANKQPLSRDKNFQSQLQCLGNTIFSGHESTTRQNQSKLGVRAAFGHDGSAFSNVSNYQTSERQMRESKKIFSNVISKMNSDKKKAENPSSQNSVFKESQQFAVESNYALPSEGLPIASFKALKQIKMIESVQPMPPPLVLQKSNSHKVSNYEGRNHFNKESNILAQNYIQQNETLHEFRVEDKNKRQRMVELINQSFSTNAPPIQKTFEDIQIEKEELILGKQANILESMYLDDSYDFKTLNTLLSKLEDQSGIQKDKKQIDMQSVKVSIENAKLSLTMNPFI